MKAISKLFIFNLFTLLALSACNDEDSVDDVIVAGDNISPVSSFSVETTDADNELLVKWVCPLNRDLDMVEISYRDVSEEVTRSVYSPGCITIPAESGASCEYLITVPYFSLYEVSAVAISKSGKRSVVENRRLTPYREKEEEVELELPAMLSRTHSYMTTIIGLYFGKSSRSCWRSNYPYNGGAYWDGDALVWGQGAGLSAFVAMREAAMESEVENIYAAMDEMMFKGIQNFYKKDHNIWAYSCYPAAGNERYYDDNVWIGLDMADWYGLTKEMRYLTQAEAVWRYLIDHGWDETCGGGVHWRELNSHTTSKHSCSTAPTAVLGCKLYLLTGEQEYLDWAIKCYDYMLNVLQDKSDHLFYDNVRPGKDDPNQPGDIEKNKYSYNSGQPLQAACLLYKITGEQKYLDEAYAIAESCHKKWFIPYRSKELNLTFNIFAPKQDMWFNTIMCRGFFELYSIDNNRKYVDDIEKSMIHAWESSCHQSNNLLNDDDLRGGTTKTSWEIRMQGALVELYARLAVLERENR